jgi:pilus assembly protein Flp/PilA
VNQLLLKLCIKLQDLADREDGQDLVEYSLVVSLISLGATASMQSLAGGISTAFSGLSSTLGTYVT